jgi:hypothetical protein
MSQHEWTGDDSERAIPTIPAPRQPRRKFHNPLYNPETDAHVFVPPLQRAVDKAREVLDEKGQANIHDRDAMIRAAYGLHYVLLDLLAALDAQRGETR